MKSSLLALLSLFILAGILPAQDQPKLILAVGLERLVPSYQGPAIRIQRPSDNTQQDIGFATGSNLLDTAAVTAFLGKSQGWIVKLYDQSGSGHDVCAPTGTDHAPTISAEAPTTISIHGTPNLTARNVKQAFAPVDGNARYFPLPAAVSINKAQASVFLAYRPDYCGNYIGMQSLYEIGDPKTDAFDIYSSASGFQGMTRESKNLAFSGSAVFSHSQPGVLGVVTTPGAPATIYTDGVAHSAGGTAAPVATCSGGYLMAGTGTALYYGMSLFAQYDFLGFEVYNGSVTADAAATISSAMLPRATVPSINIVADGDSITQGTDAIYGYDTMRYLEQQLSKPVDLTNIAIYGSPSASALGHGTYPTADKSVLASLHNAKAQNIYYLDIGTNDIHGVGGTAASTWANVQQSLKNAKALGYKTIGTTLLHEHGENPKAGEEIDKFNALIRAAVGSPYMDGLVDYEADPRLGDVSKYYPTNSDDGTHPNDAGYRVMASLAKPVFDKVVGL